MSYVLQGYDKAGQPTDDKRKIVSEKFPPEYAHIIGIPFKLFKGGKSAPPPELVKSHRITALPEREAALEITFPNVIGYRVEQNDSRLEEAKAAKAFEELGEKVVQSYVKNHFLDFKIPYVKDGKDRGYLPDFILRVAGKDGRTHNLIVEITGMSQDKAEKRWYVSNRWLPAVNAVRDKFGYDEWHFLEIAGDIRDIKNEVLDKIENL